MGAARPQCLGAVGKVAFTVVDIDPVGLEIIARHQVEIAIAVHITEGDGAGKVCCSHGIERYPSEMGRVGRTSSATASPTAAAVGVKPGNKADEQDNGYY